MAAVRQASLPIISLRVVKDAEIVCDSAPATADSGKRVYELVGAELCSRDRECFAVLHLNARMQVVCLEFSSIGCLAYSVVHPREVFKAAILNSAAGIVLVHNHPSGDPVPSDADLSITDQLVKAGKILGIPVLDHVVVASRGFVSMRETNANWFI